MYNGYFLVMAPKEQTVLKVGLTKQCSTFLTFENVIVFTLE